MDDFDGDVDVEADADFHFEKVLGRFLFYSVGELSQSDD